MPDEIRCRDALCCRPREVTGSTEIPAGVDLVHANTNGLSSMVALAAKWRAGVPFLMTEHGVYLRERYLSAGAGSETIPIKIYSAARASPTPALNALASIMLFSTLIAITIGYVVYRVLTRGERGRRTSALGDFAAQI